MSDTNQTPTSQSTEEKSSAQSQSQPQPGTKPDNPTENLPESTVPSSTTTNLAKKNNNLQDTEAASLLMLFQSQNPSNSKPNSPVNSPTSAQNETFPKLSTAPASAAPHASSISSPKSAAATTTSTTTPVDDRSTQPESASNFSSKVTPPQTNASLAETKTHKRNPSQQRLSPPLMNSLSTRSPGPVAAAMSNNNRKGAVAAAALAAAAALPLPTLMREKSSNNRKQNDATNSSPTSATASVALLPSTALSAPTITKSETQEKETVIKKEDSEDKQVKKENIKEIAKSTTNDTISASTTTSTTADSTLPPYAVDQDSGIIGCICGFEHDDGFTIQCDRCFRWQHAICMSIEDINDVPDNYLCYLCDKSLKIDKALAIKIQKERLLNLNNSDNDNEGEEEDEVDDENTSTSRIPDQKTHSAKSGKSSKTSKSSKSNKSTGLGISTYSKENETTINNTNENIEKGSSSSVPNTATSTKNSTFATVKVEKVASDSSAKTPSALPASSASVSSSASSSSPDPSSLSAANSSVTISTAKSPKQKQHSQLEKQHQASSSPPASSQFTDDKTSSDNISQNSNANNNIANTQETAKSTPPPQPTRGKPGRRGKGRGRSEQKTNANDKPTPLNEDIDSSMGRYQTLYYHIEHLEYKSSTVKHLINKLPELLNNSNNNITNDAIKISVDEFNDKFPDLQNYKKYLQIKTLPDNPKQKFTGISKLGLYTLKSLSKNDEIIIMNGEIEMKQNYIDERWNHYKTLGCPKPSVFFHPHLPIVFDLRGFGNFSRFIRKSCNPNCEIKTYILDDGSIKFGLVAKRSINQSTELTLPWEWDVDHPIREIIEGKSFENIQIRRKVELMKSIGLLLDLCECADSNLNDCYLQVVRKASSYLQRSTRKSGSSSNGNDNSNTKADEISALEFEGSYLPIMNRFESRDLNIMHRVKEIEQLWETGKLKIVNDCLIEAGAESEDEIHEDVANATINGDNDKSMVDAADKDTDAVNKSIEAGNEVGNDSSKNGADNNDTDINRPDLAKQKNDAISNISKFIRFSVKKRPFSSFANSDILNPNVPLKYDVLKKTKLNPNIVDTPSVLNNNSSNNTSNELAIPFEVHIINTPQQKESKLTATIFKDENVRDVVGVVKSELYDLRFGSGSTGSKKFNNNLSIDNNNIVKTESIVPVDATSLVVKTEDGEISINSSSVTDVPANASGIIGISGGVVPINPSSSKAVAAVMDTEKPKIVKKFSLADYKKSKANKV
ncbi:hypothetical protein BVG19_g2263 [[Candida] boidinii]|nr:hypothetical protein BVG19_g2263 [[Candida] boidinii]OWB52165.1 hypothetical protein B5S27_g3737 [[Candida] boidinii]